MYIFWKDYDIYDTEGALLSQKELLMKNVDITAKF